MILDLEQKTFTVGGVVLELPPREVKLLELLIRRQNRYVSVDSINTLIWSGLASYPNQMTSQLVLSLRKYCDGRGISIKTRRGAGYKLEVAEGLPFPVIGEQP